LPAGGVATDDRAMDNDDVRFGVVLPTGLPAGADPANLLDLAVRAEALGFASVWVGETLLRPVLEPLTFLAAAAARTERIGLGTAALLPAFRRPVQAAQAIASLDRLAHGRLTLTVGAGFPNRSEVEYAASDVPWPHRFARLDDTVALWRQVWSTDEVSSFHGTVLRIEAIPPTTRPAQPGGPPIWLGGATPAALTRAGRYYDGWLPYPPDVADYRRGLAHVRAAAHEAGRDPAAISPALFATVLITDDGVDPRPALDTYTSTTYRMPLSTVETFQLFVAGSLADVRAGIERYRDAGARHIVFRLAALDPATQRDQLDRLTHVVSTVDH
jgi:alkanesulfonate monooxygenase SsuD/methylene tetrahydromethanopterin reductase-like flavin-dependent oxidoreductase (luciferase family)